MILSNRSWGYVWMASSLAFLCIAIVDAVLLKWDEFWPTFTACSVQFCCANLNFELDEMKREALAEKPNA